MRQKSKETIEKQLAQGFDALGRDVQKALEIGKSCYAHSVHLEDKQLQAKGGILCANAYSLLGDYPQALTMAQESLLIAVDGDFSHEHCIALHALGNIYAKLGQLEQALDYYERGLNLSKGIQDSYLPRFYNNIAVIYAKLGQLQRSLFFLEESLSLYPEGEISSRGFMLTNIAEVHLKLGNIDQALTYNHLADGLLSGPNVDKIYRIQCEKVYGKLYTATHQVDRALEHMDKAMAICETISDNYRKTSIAFEVAKIYADHFAPALAIEKLEVALNLAISNQSKADEREVHSLLATCYEKAGRLKESIESLKAYININQTISTQTFEDKLALKSAELAFERHSRQNVIEGEKHKTYQNLSKIGRRIGGAQNLEGVVRTTFSELRQAMSIRHLEIIYLEGDGQRWRLICENSQGKVHYSIWSIEASEVPEVLRSRTLCPLEQVMEVKGMLTSVLYAHEAPIGTFSICRELGAWRDEDKELLEVLLSYIGIALQNAFYGRAIKLQHEAAKVLSYTDSLTGLYNRRLLHERLNAVEALSKRVNKPYAIGIIDLDHFKSINDTYGHDVGDEVLIRVAKVLKQGLRTYDALGRWGGEEFAVLLPDTTSKEAYHVCDRIRRMISDLEVAYGLLRLKVTCTIGLAISTPEDNWEDVLRHADSCLYQGKQRGRNCVVSPAEV